MKKLKISFSFFFLAASLVCGALVFSQAQEANASTELSSDDTYGVSAQSDNIVWKYKTVNGKLYKRAYNTSKAKWVGSWILIS